MYGQHVAAEMRKLNSEIVKQIVKTEIQNVFMKAHLGYYNNATNFVGRFLGPPNTPMNPQHAGQFSTPLGNATAALSTVPPKFDSQNFVNNQFGYF